jgi:excisionase family DNA binding protein
MDTKLMSTVEVGKLVGVHSVTVLRWIENNGLKSYKTVGGHNRVRFDDLLEYVKEHDLPFTRDLLQQAEKTKVLIVDNDEEVLNVLAESLKVMRGRTMRGLSASVTTMRLSGQGQYLGFMTSLRMSI